MADMRLLLVTIVVMLCSDIIAREANGGQKGILEKRFGATSYIFTICRNDFSQDCMRLTAEITLAQHHYDQLRKIQRIEETLAQTKDPRSKQIIESQLQSIKDKYSAYSTQDYRETLSEEGQAQLEQARFCERNFI